MHARLVLALAATLGAACRIDTEIEVATATDALVETGDEPGALPFAPAGPDAAPDPSTFGPYPVGVMTLALADESRLDENGVPRPMVIEVWYPADESTRGGEGYTYGLADFLRPEALAMVDPGDAEIVLPTEAVRDAPPRPGEAPMPVVLFSHGAAGLRMQSTFLTVALASHGYVVASPDHYGNTLSDAILAGGLDEAALFASTIVRPDDILFARDHLVGLGGGDPLGALVDATRVGVAGHSFGAWTSLRLLANGEDFHAVVAEAPPGADIVWIGAPIVQPEDVTTPVMIHAGVADTTTPVESAQGIYDRLGGPKSLLTLRTAGHFTFSDMCLFDAEAIAGAMELGIGAALDDGCANTFIPAVIALPTLRHFAIGHFNAELRGSPGSAALLTQAEGDRLAPSEAVFVQAF